MMKLSDHLYWYNSKWSAIVIIQSRTKSIFYFFLLDHMACLVHVVMHSWLFCGFFLMSFKESRHWWLRLAASIVFSFLPSPKNVIVIHGFMSIQLSFQCAVFCICLSSQCESSYSYVTKLICYWVLTIISRQLILNLRPLPYTMVNTN